MPRVTKNPEERRSEILDAAEQLFNSKGYDQTAVSDIVKQVGVAQGTFYYYFKSKEEIANAIIDRWQASMLEQKQLVKMINACAPYVALIIEQGVREGAEIIEKLLGARESIFHFPL